MLKMGWLFFITASMLMCVTDKQFAQASTIGTQFVFSLPNHMQRGGGDDVFILVESRFSDAKIHVQAPNIRLQFDKNITQGVTEIKFQFRVAENNADYSFNSIFISSDTPISVHVIDFVTHNADGILLLPVTARDKEFYAMSYTPDLGIGKSQISIATLFQRTTVTIKVKTKPGSSFRWRGHNYTNGNTIRVNLNRLQIIQIQHDEDLTGTHITTNKPVSVVSGSSCSFVPVQYLYCDCLYAQIPPVSSWGTSFLLAKLQGRLYNRFRVLAARDHTTVTVGNLGTFTINNGEFIENRTDEDSIIHIYADKPILVVQLSESGEADKQPGDPFMAIIASTEHFSDGYLFMTPGHFAFHHVSITIETDLADGLRLNGQSISRNDENTTNVLENGNMMEYSIIRIPLKHGTYNLTHVDAAVRFGGLMYGFDEYLSYGYSLGYRTDVLEDTRLVGGISPAVGTLQVNMGGTWSGVCADGIGQNEAKVICKSLGYGNHPIVPHALTTSPSTNPSNVTEILPTLKCSGRERRLDQCAVSLGYHHNCTNIDDVMVDCAPRLLDVIKVKCTSASWLVDIDMDQLNLRYPGSVASDIHLGDNTCRGTESGHVVHFQNDINSCFTSQTKTNGHTTYTNQLVYAYLDQAQPTIIRDFNWTLNIQCDVYPNGTALSHSALTPAGSPTMPPHQNTSSKYHLAVKIFSDPNFITAIPDDPIRVALGTMLYVQTYVPNVDWNVQMRLSTCYTSESRAASAPKYFLIKDGCEVDANTQLISKSEHETKFQFQMFEMTKTNGSLYLHCDAVFCDSSQPASLAQCAHHCSLAG